jgi:uncharacterized membrane protein YoaK (UPF0700 family)
MVRRVGFEADEPRPTVEEAVEAYRRETQQGAVQAKTPKKRDWFGIIFLSVWSLLWAGAIALAIALASSDEGPDHLFLIVWVVFAIIALNAALRRLVKSWRGK